MQRTLQQNSTLHALIGKLGISPDVKEQMVFNYTGGRTNSSAGMTYHECESLIKFLQQSANAPGQEDKANLMRRKIFSIAHELGWENQDGTVNSQHLSQWLLKYGYLHKPLNDYTLRELPRLLTQFENLLK